MPVISRQIGLRHDRTSFDKKNPKKNGAGQHTAFFTWTWRASFAKLTNDHVSWCLFVLVFSREISLHGPLHDEKLPNSYSLVAFPSVLKHLSSDTVKGCSSSSWVAAYLGSTTSLSTSEKKSNNPHIALRRKDVFSSSHRSLRSRSYSVPSQGRRDLELCRSVDCALASRFLAPVHVYIHFQAYWACLVVIETNESLCSGMMLRTLLGDRHGRRKNDGRKRFFFFAVAAPQGPKVRTERVCSLCFHAFSWFLCLTKP